MNGLYPPQLSPRLRLGEEVIRYMNRRRTGRDTLSDLYTAWIRRRR